MKKFLCLILALVLCVSVFVACDKTKQPQDPDVKVALDNATAYLKTMYKGYLSNPETPSDFDLVTKVTVDEKVYNVEWSVDNNAVKVVTAEDKSKVTIDIDEKSASVVEYKLTAVVTAPDGTKGNPLTFKLKVPKSSIMSIADALKAEDGKFVTVSGTVVLINTPWDDGYKNISVTIEDENGDKLYLYRLATKVEVGDIITVKGEMATYNNARQVAAGATAEITGKAEVNLEYKEMTIPQVLAAEDGTLVIVNGTVKSVDTPWSDQYKNITVTIVDAQGNELYIYRLATNVVAGDTITVKGVVGSYNGNKQIAQGATAEIGAAHGDNHVYSFDCDATCDICGATRDGVTHTYAFACSTECSVCKTAREDAAEHTWTNACDAACDVCSVTRQPDPHVYANDCDADCDVCAATREVTHKVTAPCDVQCDLCGAAITTTVAHTVDYACDKVCKVCNSAIAVDCKDEDENGKCDICDKTVDAKTIEKNHIDTEAAKLVFADVHISGVYDLPAKGTDWTDVTITWAVDNSNVAKIENGKLILTASATDVTVKLTATLTCGSTTETKEYTFKITAHAYDNACDADCNICKTTRTPAECVDANKDGKCDSCGAAVEVDDGTTSIPDVLASAEGVDVVVKGTVESFYYAWDDSYGNCSVYIVDADGNKLLCFRMVTKVNIGDQITVTGTTTSYNNVIQLAQGCSAVINVAHVCSSFNDATCTTPKTCTVCNAPTGQSLGHNFTNGVCSVCGEYENATVVELDMLGSTTRTNYSTSQTVHSANGITYTNDKASSTNNNYDNTGKYAARAYKGSTIKIECANMTKIVLTLDDYNGGDYIEGLDNMTVEGATITRNNDVVTIVLSSVVNSFQSGELASQIRIEKIEVYTVG